MQFLSSSIGRKILMAISGLLMLLFVTAHLAGNMTIYGLIPGGINAYARHLHAFPPVVWGARAFLLAVIAIHLFFGIQLTVENSDCRQQKYAVRTLSKTTFASENMIWTGLLLLAFIVFHILHFTAKMFPGMDLILDSEGAVDVFAMVVSAFRNVSYAVIYAGAMAALFLHLYHGIQSLFQTLGLSDDRTLPRIVRAGAFVALALFLGFVSVPASIFFDFLK